MGCRSGGKWNASWLEQAVDEEKEANKVWRCPGLGVKMLPDAERMADQVVRKEVWLLKAGSGGRGGAWGGRHRPSGKRMLPGIRHRRPTSIRASIFFCG